MLTPATSTTPIQVILTQVKFNITIATAYTSTIHKFKKKYYQAYIFMLYEQPFTSRVVKSYEIYRCSSPLSNVWEHTKKRKTLKNNNDISYNAAQ